MLCCSHNLFIWQSCLPCVCLISVTAFSWHILGHSIFWLTQSTHKSLICSSNKDDMWEHNSRFWCVDRHWWFLWLASHLPTVGGKWTSGQYIYKWTVLMNWQVSTSDKYLLDRPVLGTWLYVWDKFSVCTMLVGDTAVGHFEESLHSFAALLMASLCHSRRNIKCFYWKYCCPYTRSSHSQCITRSWPIVLSSSSRRTLPSQNLLSGVCSNSGPRHTHPKR